MKILVIRTDNPEAEVGIYENGNKLAYKKWHAHRELSVTLPGKIDEILNKLSISYANLDGLIVFRGPGSFTGLRIGLAAANAMAYAQKLPIVAAGGPDWIEAGLKRLMNGQNDEIALPEYGSPPHVTKQKK